LPAVVEESPEITYFDFARSASLKCIVGDKKKDKRSFYNGGLNLLSGPTGGQVCAPASYVVEYATAGPIQSGTIPSGGSETIVVPDPSVCADATVENSNSSYTDSVVSGGTLVLPDITVTDSDGSTYTQPSVENVVCTLSPDTDLEVNGTPEGTFVAGSTIEVNITDGVNPVTPDAVTVVGDVVTIEVPSGGGGGGWQRPSDWLTMPTVLITDQTFVGLHAVFPNGNNFAAFRFTTNTGSYQVDWGDGTVTTHASNFAAEHTYDYVTYDPTNATLSTRGYKQAMITVTPVSGNLTGCSFQFRRTTVPAQSQPYATGFLDCILSMPNANTGSSILFGGSTVAHRYVERFDIKTIGSCTSMSQMFITCSSLQSVPLFDTSSVTTMVSMFNFCSFLQSVPLFDTSSVTTMATMFFNCSSLQFVPLFDTNNVTTMVAMFSGCTSLQFVSLFNTSNVTTMASMFFNCKSLTSIPALSTAAITTTTGSDFTNFAINSSSLYRIEMIFARTVNISNCQLSRDALVEIFTNLVDRTSTTAANININGNWGAAVGGLSVLDRAIATGKNWTITG
jgi:surface protein